MERVQTADKVGIAIDVLEGFIEVPQQAIAGGRMFVRTATRVMCLEEKANGE